MRPVWLVFALGACNQIYGLEPTRARDAAETPSDRAVHLALLVGGTTTTGTEAPVAFEALPDPRPRLGAIDATLRDATYVPEPGMGGLVDYPFELVNKPWRLEYQPPFGAVHELQWNPPVGAGYAVVPLAGRVARTSPPDGAGYTLSMKIGGVAHDFPANTVIYTSGYWSATATPFATQTPSVVFADPASVSLEGPRSVPSAAAGDLVVAVEYGVEAATQCRLAVLSGGAKVVDIVPTTLQPIVLSPHFGTVTPSDTPLAVNGETLAAASGRLTGALGPLAAPSTDGRLRFGRIAHAAIPAFTTALDDVPAPPMIPIFDCPITKTPTSNSNNVGGSLSFTTAYHGSITSDRTANGVRLRSSIAFVGLLTNGAYQVSTEVPLPTAVKLGATSLATDGATLLPADRDLTFTFDRGSPYVVDYVEATLYRIENSALVPVRVYVTADSPMSIRIDPSLVTAGAPHVFAIRTYRGQSRASSGDFRAVDGRQSVATIFTSTFTR